MRHRGRGIGDQPFEKSGRPRRGGDHLPRPRAKAQSELQHIEGRFGMTPLGKLVRPGGGKLQAAQALGIFRRKRLRDRAVVPFEPPPRRKPLRPLVARGAPRADRTTPSIITSRTSCSVSPTSAMRAALPLLERDAALTHSAPARVLPAPRPPRISQVVQSFFRGRSLVRVASGAKSKMEVLNPMGGSSLRQHSRFRLLAPLREGP